VTESGAPRALVTGASGFVGGHLVDALRADGWAVRCLVRLGSDRRWLPPTGLDLVVGSTDDDASLRRAVEGMGVVFHLAAVTSAARAADYDRVNRAGVERLLEALSAAAPRARLVFCSSLAAAGPARAGRPLTEADPAAPIGPYGASKAEAERAVGRAVTGRGLSAAIVRPPAVYGPRDRDVLAAFRLAAHGLAIRTGPPAQRLAMVHVSDLVRGLCAAAATPTASGVYYVNGGNHEWEEIIQAMGAAVGRRPRVIGLPAPVVMAAGYAARPWARLTGVKPLLTPERARDLVQPAWTCDDARARRDLAYSPRIGLTEGMAATAAWYRARGWL
jgi:nucleoside-diphosphate-sugar epimerase